MDTVLKYTAWVLSISIPFVGAWFFQYTTTNESSSRKVITRPGYYALGITVISIILGLIISVKEDIKSNKSKVQNKALEEEKKDHREEVAFLLTENVKRSEELISSNGKVENLLIIMNRNSRSLSQNDVRELSLISNENQELSVDVFKKKYPDLYARISLSPSFEVISDSIEDALTRDFSSGFVSSEECLRIMPLDEKGIIRMNIIQGGEMAIGVSFFLAGTKKLIFFQPGEIVSTNPRRNFEQGIAITSGKGRQHTYPCDNTSPTYRCELHLAGKADLVELIKMNGISKITVGQSEQGHEFNLAVNVSNEIEQSLSCLR